MKYLNANATIIIEEEKREISFSEKKENNKVTLNDTKQWNIFLYLLKNEGKECFVRDMELRFDIINPSNEQNKSGIKQYICNLRVDLNKMGIPTNKHREEDETKISIKNKRNSTLNGRRNGSYTLILPKTEHTSKKTFIPESVIARLFWNRYVNLSTQKDGENKNDEIIAELGDVYQFPLMEERGCTCKWDINMDDSYTHNILIEAPNGYGKSTFMRSIILASIYPYIENLSVRKKSQYEKIRSFHGINNTDFFIYIECKDIDLVSLDKYESIEWVYYTLSKMESINLSNYMNLDTFASVLQNHSTQGKLVLLIDGFDEISSESRLVLINKLNQFQHDSKPKISFRIIMTARPLFWKIDLNGYKKYVISNRNIIENQDVLLNYIRSYSMIYKSSINFEKIHSQIISNSYLKNLACTPASIVWILKELLSNNEFYSTVERIIEQMMLRYNSRELTVSKDLYKRIYEMIAYNYLRLSNDDNGLTILNTELIAIIRNCIDDIKREGNKRFNRVFSSENKEDEILGELFFTNVSLLEIHNNKLRFATHIYAEHLAARDLLRQFIKEGANQRVIDWLDNLPSIYRYNVMVIASTLALHLTDNRFFSGFGNDANDIRFYAKSNFYKYLFAKLNNPQCTIKEKLLIQNAIAQIMLKHYGENVFTNRNMNSDDIDQIKWLKSIILTDLGTPLTDTLKFREGHGDN